MLRSVIEAVFQTRVIFRARAGIHDSRKREPHHGLGDRVVRGEQVGEEGVGAAVVGAAWFGEAEADGGFDVCDGPARGSLFHGGVVHLETAVADDGGAVTVDFGVGDGFLGLGFGCLGGWGDDGLRGGCAALLAVWLRALGVFDLVVDCKAIQSAWRVQR